MQVRLFTWMLWGAVHWHFSKTGHSGNFVLKWKKKHLERWVGNIYLVNRWGSVELWETGSNIDLSIVKGFSSSHISAQSNTSRIEVTLVEFQ